MSVGTVYSERSDRWMKERRKMSDVLGIKNVCECWAQLTFTKRLSAGRRQSNGWNVKLGARCSMV